MMKMLTVFHLAEPPTTEALLLPKYKLANVMIIRKIINSIKMPKCFMPKKNNSDGIRPLVPPLRVGFIYSHPHKYNNF